MDQQKSVLSKLALVVMLPVIIIGCIMVASLVTVSETGNQTILISIIGMAAMLLVIFLGIKNISARIQRIAQRVAKIAEGELIMEYQPDSGNDSLGQLDQALYQIVSLKSDSGQKLEDLAKGNIDLQMSSIDGKDQMSQNLAQLQHNLLAFNSFCEELSQIEDYDFSGIEQKHLSGQYKTMAESIINTIEKIDSERAYYLALLDALPYRITGIDENMRITFINKTLEDLCLLTGSIKHDRSEMVATKCADCNLQMCGTEDCGIRRLNEKGLTEYPFVFRDRHYRMDTQPVKDKAGKKIGYVEISHDTTPTASVSAFSDQEVVRLNKNLAHLASGNLEFDMNTTKGNEYTGQAESQFKEIDDNLLNVKNSISKLIEGITMMTRSVIDGNLEARADENGFFGSWLEIITGMNELLQTIEMPITEVSQVMQAISGGELNVSVEGDYNGRFEDLKQTVNEMGSNFKIIIKLISETTQNIARGNLALDQLPSFGGEFDSISSSLNLIVDTLNNLLKDIQDATDQVNTGASQVADSSQSLAQGSTEQASSVEELTASISEIANQTKNNAVNANKARELTNSVMLNAEKGNAQMSEMQVSMVGINQSSEDITKIIKVIDDIAFQTNILALNAAVEAARAGQHGKGFAVVAEEVRTLAARSADAAKETTVLIEDSINKVKAGTKIADETAGALHEIVAGIDQVNDLIGSIATDSNNQATGISHINTGVEQVAQVVQQNSATAEESAAASEELSSQSTLLKNRLNQFKLR